MSRIIVTRHENGQERLVTGFDRALQRPFLDLYDDEGDCMISRGMEPDVAPLDLHEITEMIGRWEDRGYGTGVVAAAQLDHLDELLEQHSRLEYPASNVVVDLTRPQA